MISCSTRILLIAIFFRVMGLAETQTIFHAIHPVVISFVNPLIHIRYDYGRNVKFSRAVPSSSEIRRYKPQLNSVLQTLMRIVFSPFRSWTDSISLSGAAERSTFLERIFSPLNQSVAVSFVPNRICAERACGLITLQYV